MLFDHSYSMSKMTKMIMVVVKILSRFTSLILKETNTPEQILKLIHAITTKNIGSLCYHNTYKYVDSIIIIVVIINIIITRPKPAYAWQGLAGLLLRASGAQLGSDDFS